MMDIESARELRQSALWTKVCEEIDSWIRAEELKLRQCTAEELPILQVRLQAFEQVKTLPDVVIERVE